MTAVLALAPIIARALQKLAQVPDGAALPPVAPDPSASAPAAQSAAPVLPDIKPIVQSQLPKTPAAPASAVVPDAGTPYRDFVLNDRTKFNPAAHLQSPEFQRAYAARPPGEQPMTPEQWLPQARQRAEDFQRTANPGGYAGYLLNRYKAGDLTAEDFANQTAALHDSVPADQQKQFSEDRAAVVFGQKPSEVYDRRSAAHSSLTDPANAMHPVDTFNDAKALKDPQGTGQVDQEVANRMNAAMGAGKTKGEFVDQEMANDIVDKQVAPLLAQAVDPSKPVAEKPGFMDNVKQFMSEPRNWIVPVAALAVLFGGKTSKILGGLALAGGAVDLYNRYQGIKAMGDSPEGQAAYKEGVTFKDEKGQPKPFGNVAELVTKYPQQARALQDTSLLFNLGLRDQFDRRVITAAVERASHLGVSPDMALDRFVARKDITVEQAKAVREEIAQSTAAAAKRQSEAQAAATQAVTK